MVRHIRWISQKPYDSLQSIHLNGIIHACSFSKSLDGKITYLLLLTSVGCEPLRDRVDQPDVRQYISVHFIHSLTRLIPFILQVNFFLNLWPFFYSHHFNIFFWVGFPAYYSNQSLFRGSTFFKVILLIICLTLLLFQDTSSKAESKEWTWWLRSWFKSPQRGSVFGIQSAEEGERGI